MVDGISVDKRMILAPDKLGRMTGPSLVVADAHDARAARVHLDMPARRMRSSSASTAARGGAGGVRRLRGGVGVIRDAGVDGVFVDHADLGVAFFRG